MQKEKSLGFIGTGVMGSSMVRHLLAAGYPVHVFSRTKSRAEPLLEAGAQWEDSPGAVAAASQVCITMVGFPSDVEEVYFSSGGILDRAQPGSLLIDMTTSSPALARRIGEAAEIRGLEALDAPVSGGDAGAREARLSIMVGGKKAAYEEAREIFQILGKTIVRQGDWGAGQSTKMANQIAIASLMIGVSEAMAYTEATGLDPESVLQSISTGAAGSWTLSNLTPRALRGDFAPGFYIKHFLKDLGIALESARELDLKLPGVKLAQELYERMAAAGDADLGTQALLKLYRERRGN